MSNFNVSSLLDSSTEQSKSHNESESDEHKILFVCTGNIARSASAVYLARSLSSENSGWTFDSAGIGAVVDSGIAPFINEELAKRDVDFSDHKAKQITEEMVESASLVLVMDTEHLNWIVREWPQYRVKVHLLRQMARLRSQAGRRVDPISYMKQFDIAPLPEDEIADPYGKGADPARLAVQQVEEALETVVPWLAN